MSGYFSKYIYICIYIIKNCSYHSCNKLWKWTIWNCLENIEYLSSCLHVPRTANITSHDSYQLFMIVKMFCFVFFYLVYSRILCSYNSGRNKGFCCHRWKSSERRCWRGGMLEGGAVSSPQCGLGYQVQIGAISYYALRLTKMQINTVKFRQKIYM